VAKPAPTREDRALTRRRGWLPRQWRRGLNAARRLSRGLPLHAECVSPEVPNDLFVAHLSIYEFASGFVRGRDTLDLGCGTGYGSARLVSAGAASVTGLDRDPRSIAYARSRYGAAVRFLEGDAQSLPEGLGPFGAIVSSNVFEHLPSPSAAFDEVRSHLAPGGVFVLVVPPIVDPASLAANRAIPFHVSNLFVQEWADLLKGRFQEVRAFRHLPPDGTKPDFTDPFPSRLKAEEFRFVEVPVAALGSELTLGAVFVALT
jgi:SAM-dependent methyltransferase